MAGVATSVSSPVPTDPLDLVPAELFAEPPPEDDPPLTVDEGVFLSVLLLSMVNGIVSLISLFSHY